MFRAEWSWRTARNKRRFPSSWTAYQVWKSNISTKYLIIENAYWSSCYLERIHIYIESMSPSYLLKPLFSDLDEEMDEIINDELILWHLLSFFFNFMTFPHFSIISCERCLQTVCIFMWSLILSQLIEAGLARESPIPKFMFNTGV